MDLIRELLLQIENFPAGCGGKLQTDEISEAEVGHRPKLLVEAGFIAGHYVTT